MKFASIYLQNYIGIYNGMGLSEIFIDFTRATHRTIVIRGDNGSGKSTIMKSLSLFPDGNEQFIPNLPAKKEIVLVDGAISYTLTFIHGVKGNGQREVTKAYITKNIAGVPSKLNENGNVTSFKDILNEELGLDPNFEALSQLSTEDRGIADKKPADRKKFVNSILDNLETYNDIYKSLTKRSTSYKNLITSITNKLGSIGDPMVIASNVAGIEERINNVQDRKDQAVEELARAKSKMEILDPDGSIQAIIERIKSENESFNNELNSIMRIITSSRLGCNISLTENIKTIIEDTKAKISSLDVDNQIKRGQIESFLRERESETKELTSKIQRLQSFEQEWRYESICDEIANNEAIKANIESEISIIGPVDISTISKESFILALESINKIAENIQNLKDQFEYHVLENIVEKYIKTNSLDKPYDLTSKEKEYKDVELTIRNLEHELIRLDAEIKTLDALNLRPKGCNIDSCPYIKEAVDIQKKDPKSARLDVFENLQMMKSTSMQLNAELDLAYQINACITQFNNLIRDIDRNKAIISKLPFGKMFEDKAKLLEAIFKGNYSDYLKQVYKYIYLANSFDEYKVVTDSLSRLYTEKSIYESKHDILTEIQLDIDRINQKLEGLDQQISPIQNSIAMNDRQLISLRNSLGSFQMIADNEKRRDELQELIDKNDQLYKSNIDKINQINEANKQAIRQATIIEAINRELSPLMIERDRLNHQMRLVDDYNKELEQLNTHYKLLETIRYYSSPTTGIQLVFMEMYMGKVIQIANNLLNMFFNGQFTILPFVINESEFRIPCAGEGIVNDDISSMSSAQIAMISMILSFSFLYNSSTKYNILKLDEIDGPLDANNRLMFLDVLNNVMNMMGTEQCIMISHNTELQAEDSDIILLKSSENNDYSRGNIIWKY